MSHSMFVRAVARHLFLPTWMVALALIARGHHSTGDGFSAALLVVLGGLLQYLAFGHRHVEQPGREPRSPTGARLAGTLVPLRWLPRFVGIGLLALLTAVLAPMLVGALPLTHFPRPAQAVPHLGSFALHTGFVVDLGVFLVVLGFGLTIMSRVSRHADDDAGPGLGADTDTDSDTGADTDTDTDTDSDTDTGADTDSDTDTGADTDSDTDADTDTDTGADTDSDTGADTESDTGVSAGTIQQARSRP